MPVFITAVLAAAAIQSCCKLTLLGRMVQYLFLVLLIVMVFITSDMAASASLLEFRRMLCDACTLNELCGLVIIQEFANIIFGFSLLGSDGVPEKLSHKIFYGLKFLTFIPSILLFYGVWYSQMYLFNTLVEYSFADLTLAAAIIWPVASLAVMELIRLFFRKRDLRILVVMHLEFLLVVPAVFLPVAAGAELISAPEEKFPSDTLVTLAILVATVLVNTVIFTIYNNKHRKGLSCRK